jgi:hypothetical protein
MRRRRFVACLLLTPIWGGCTRTAIAPTPVSSLIPQPIHNVAPSVDAITLSATRVEVGERVDVVASVSDPETPIANLQFNWRSNVGQVSGTGPHVTWQLAPGSPTPADAVVTLEVVERYDDFSAAGAPIVSEHRVERSSEAVRVHDSPAEITAMSVAFLVDKFGNSAVSPEACLVDFSDSCQGKGDELSDIRANRQTFTILDASARVLTVAFDFARTRADIDAPCVFHDRRLDNGLVGTSAGDCLLTAVYESRRWWLCDSHFR